MVEGTLTGRLDTAAQNLNPTRQSNTVSGIPLGTSSFRHGVTSLPKLKSQEFPSVLMVLMVLLGMQGLYFTPQVTRQVQHALVGLYLCWYVLKRTWFDREELEKLPELIKRTMLHWRAAFRKDNKSGCRFPKFHSFLHYYHFIKEYGAPALTYGGWWEKAHMFLVKAPYLRTGKRVNDMYPMLMMRIALTDTVRQKSAILVREREVLRRQQGQPGTGSKKRRLSGSCGARSAMGAEEEDVKGRDKTGYLTIEEG